jgi:hypothetical protein
VATKPEMTVNRNQWSEKSLFDVKQRKAKGILTRYTASKYN